MHAPQGFVHTPPHPQYPALMNVLREAFATVGTVAVAEVRNVLARMGQYVSDEQLGEILVGMGVQLQLNYHHIEKLARHLVAPARGAEEKARVLNRWVAANISYNFKGLAAGNCGDNSAEGVLRSGMGVCAGYARLFKALCNVAGVECIEVTGYAKGTNGSTFQGTNTNHAWAAVRLDSGCWGLVDSTWCSELMYGKCDSRSPNVDHSKYNDFFFLPRPELMLFCHLPKDTKWALLPPGIAAPSLQEFVKNPKFISQVCVQPKSHLEREIRVRAHNPPTASVTFGMTFEVFALRPSDVELHTTIRNDSGGPSCTAKAVATANGTMDLRPELRNARAGDVFLLELEARCYTAEEGSTRHFYSHDHSWKVIMV
ncbi:hypothetical protein FOA52_000648 [Chlamydomonas sp. UWO 241]|nr:hypothetical protein FOA52_000648 [Chlamydomonas sp. UWO 241]